MYEAGGVCLRSTGLACMAENADVEAPPAVQPVGLRRTARGSTAGAERLRESRLQRSSSVLEPYAEGEAMPTRDDIGRQGRPNRPPREIPEQEYSGCYREGRHL